MHRNFLTNVQKKEAPELTETPFHSTKTLNLFFNHFSCFYFTSNFNNYKVSA